MGVNMLESSKYCDYTQIMELHPEIVPDDLKGNDGIGRYVFLCGSSKRAKTIGSSFEDPIVREHPRGHDLFLGKIDSKFGKIDVASISTGMGCPSADVILHQLFANGAKRFLRIGTAGSLQPNYIKTGSVVVATAAVRDEHTSMNYIGLDYPAVASAEMVQASFIATDNLQLSDDVFSGIVHTKDSIFARELGCSHLQENYDYMRNLKQAGVIASDMECSHIFVLSSILNFRATKEFSDPANNVLSGAILAIVGDDNFKSSNANMIGLAIDRAIQIGFETVRELYNLDMTKRNKK